jgi:hypothetical protein
MISRLLLQPMVLLGPYYLAVMGLQANGPKKPQKGLLIWVSLSCLICQTVSWQELLALMRWLQP